MKDEQDLPGEEPNEERREDKVIEQGFEQLELLYKSRCVQAPAGSNVTVREIAREE